MFPQTTSTFVSHGSYLTGGLYGLTSGGYGGGYGGGLLGGGGYGGLLCAGIGIACVASTIFYLINAVLVPLIFALSFVVFLYGVARTYIFSNGEPSEVEKGHKVILWGIIGFVIMVSLWGLVNVVANTFGLAGLGAPYLPITY